MKSCKGEGIKIEFGKRREGSLRFLVMCSLLVPGLFGMKSFALEIGPSISVVPFWPVRFMHAALMS